MTRPVVVLRREGARGVLLRISVFPDREGLTPIVPPVLCLGLGVLVVSVKYFVSNVELYFSSETSCLDWSKYESRRSLRTPTFLLRTWGERYLDGTTVRVRAGSPRSPVYEGRRPTGRGLLYPVGLLPLPFVTF